MDISIIIVNWNTKHLLLDCIGSLLSNKNCYKTEIIVVDNGSTDGSRQAIREHFPEVKLIWNKSNVGFAKANNTGIKASTGRYMALVNTDIVAGKGCLEQMCRYMDQNPSIGILGPKLLWPDMSLQISCRRFPTLWNNFCPAIGLTRLFDHVRFFSDEHMRYFGHDSICDVDALMGAFMLVRKKAIDQVGMLDELFFFYCEEIDWCKRFHNASWRVAFFPQAQAVHYSGASSSMQPTEFKQNLILSNYKFWKKLYGRFKQPGFIIIMFLRHIIRIFTEDVVYIVKLSEGENVEINLKSRIKVMSMLLKMRRNTLGV